MKKFTQYLKENVSKEHNIIDYLNDAFLELVDDYSYKINIIEKGYFIDGTYISNYPSEGEVINKAIQIEIECLSDCSFKSLDESPFLIITNFVKSKSFDLDYNVYINFNSNLSVNRYSGGASKQICFIILVNEKEEVDSNLVKSINDVKSKLYSLSKRPLSYICGYYCQDDKMIISLKISDMVTSNYSKEKFTKDISDIVHRYNAVTKTKIKYEIKNIREKEQVTYGTDIDKIQAFIELA